ncbi:Cation efflux system protein CusA [Acidisarcina polymorpha]|uniref:Cation efflux system protein CusA n=1 Tax=Acidisarcina polymorpha TaxID=2211140 RepID=A0A2Z5G9C6_9BACT|nr:TolC family protein [Acidisarcina polymorpha]AXC15294.1 Cation efflux system protein CusA [Acidisarcina polymorpha]
MTSGRFGSLVILLSLALGGFALRAQTAPAPLTLEQALALARTRNPSLLSGRQHVTATRASEVTAGFRQNPSFTLSGADVSLPANNPANPYSYTANVSRLFERGEKRRWRLDVARAATDVTQSQYGDTERQTILQVKQAFTNMLAAKAALKIAGDNLASYSRTVDLSKARLNAGDISATDFDRIDLQLAEFEADTNAAKLDLIQASDQLQLLLGIARSTTTFDITGTLDPPALTQTLEQMEQSALAARPDYQAAVQSVRVADASIHLADAEGTTDPTVGGEYERTATYNSAGFQISIPLRVFDRNQGEKERTRYEAQASRFAETAARNQVINDVDQAWAGYEAAVEMATRYNNHFVAEAQRVRDNLEYSYRHGGTTLLDYLDALRDYRQVNLGALTANQQVWLSIHQLSFAAATEILP